MLTQKGRNLYLILSGLFLSFPLYFFLLWNDKIGSYQVSKERMIAYLSDYSFLSFQWVNYISLIMLLFSLSFIMRLIQEKNLLKWIGLSSLLVCCFLFVHYLRLIF